MIASLCIVLFLGLATAFTPKSGVKYSAVHDKQWRVEAGSHGIATGIWTDTLHSSGTMVFRFWY